MARFHSLKVKDVQRETDDAVSIAFDVPADMNGTFEFEPGQYLTVRARIDGSPQQRTYSICSGLDDGELRIAVKRVEGGVFSNFANDNLAAGIELDVMPPLGRFTAKPGENEGARYAAFAAGSGMTPIFSIVKTLLERESDSTFTLFYGNRNCGSVIFREQLEDLKDRFLERFTLVHVLSREGQHVDLLHGRLDADRIATFARTGLFDPETVTTFFLCGPGNMIENGRKALEDLGVSPDRIRFELFTTGREGLESTSPMSERAKATVSEGEVEMAANYSLEPWELEAEFVLTCQARPLTSKVVLDYDKV